MRPRSLPHHGVLEFLSLFLPCILANQGTARAGGYEYEVQGVDTVGRSGANVAHVSDPSALYLNVAGIGKSDDVQVIIDSNFVDLDLGVKLGGGSQVSAWQVGGVDYPYMYVENKDEIFPGPMIAGSFGVPRAPGLVLALGVFGPAAVGNYTYDMMKTVETPSGPAEVPGPQRYDLVREEVLFFWPTIAAAYRITPKLVIGAGFQWGILDFTYETVGSMAVVRNTQSYQSDFISKVRAKDWFVPAGLLGVTWQPLDWLEAGLSLRLSGNVDAKASKKDIVITMDPWGDDPIRSNDPTLTWMDDPDSSFSRPHGRVWFAWPTLKLRAGVRFALPRKDAPASPAGGPLLPAHVREWFDVELDVFFETSGQVDKMWMKVEGQAPNGRLEGQAVSLNPASDGKFAIERGWKHCVSLRLGGDVNLWKGRISLAWGGFWDLGAAPKAYTRLDYMAFDRFGVSVGAIFRLWKLEFKFAYMHIFYPDRVVTNGDVHHLQGTGLNEGSVINNGTYSVAIDIFSAGIAGRF